MAASFGETPMGLSSQVMNVAAVLTRKAGLKVPRYQRPYTWGEREVRELIQDLHRAFTRRATFYFIGTIVLVKNNRGQLEVSDGQQRLATLTMIIAYVRDRLPGRAKMYQSLVMEGDRPRLMLREADASFYRGFVQEPGKMVQLAKHAETGVESKDLLCAAAQTIEDELASLDDRELDSFMSYIARCCTLNVVDADERGCAQTVFASLNRRGSPLSGADIIKSDLIENSHLGGAEADEAARKWEETEDKFPRADFAHLLDMMPFLLTGEHLLSPGDLAAFRAAVEKAGGVRSFLFEQLPRYADTLKAIESCAVSVGAASADVNRRIHGLKQVERWYWAPVAIAFVAEHAHEHERARRFFQALDCFTYAAELAAVDNRRVEARLARALRALGDDKTLFGEAALGLTPVEFRKLIATLNRSRKRDRQRRLLMIRLELALPNGNRLTMTDDVTVEHILPKNGGGVWNETFPDAVRRNDLANLVGNQILTTDEQNKRAGAKSYAEKRKIYFNTPQAPVHQLTKDIAGLEQWNPDVIEDRQERLLEALCSDWGLRLAAAG
ncbi:MAG: DUF262 domain-containing protein [Hyphomonadaceae bacterium]|nr:DUF262 domain-containing protein [Hyphomonadaceae bacterium]